ncbi:iron-sulfur protein [Mycobacterium sp. IS-1742]|uniref:PDR/VanB family oxidoreductase n=1 Tax=Mycobacterium sp. IS-1742 TaxID=1772285 RepID=UPI00073FF8DC|nr:PDR/VanB family oxidoreductase [Mycobacterium sp. IS-1742]KUI24820.1 iron-sulfur protein [Mycobacterium sp. IS-1742]
MRLRVTQLGLEADGVISVTFRDPQGAPLPPWTAGAHLSITLKSGLVRQYSLCGPGDDPSGYTVAVLLVVDGRGGSREVHEQLRVGDLVEVEAPRNNFALTPAPEYLFLAGGIGVTPIAAMLDELHALHDSPRYRLVYGGRTLSSMAFVDRLTALGGDRVELVPFDERGLPDLTGALEGCAPGTHVYCCGPAAMISAVQEATSRYPDVVLHVERFSASADAESGPLVTDGSFEVELARSGMTITVPPDRTVLDAVLDALPDTAFSCTSGFCGTCETKVLGGAIDHRDDLLTDAERQANTSMMICVSRSKDNARVVLDL